MSSLWVLIVFFNFISNQDFVISSETDGTTVKFHLGHLVTPSSKEIYHGAKNTLTDHKSDKEKQEDQEFKEEYNYNEKKLDEEYQKHPEGNEKTDEYRANMKYLVRKRRRQKLQEKEFVHSAILHQVEQYLDRLGEFIDEERGRTDNEKRKKQLQRMHYILNIINSYLGKLDD